MQDDDDQVSISIDATEQEAPKKVSELPDEIYILPITRRLFFPGMAAPLTIEPGPQYEVLKILAKSESKYLGLVMTKAEEIDPYKVTFKDLHKVGVLARILRIIPIEQGGAQIVVNMEHRFRIVEPIKPAKYLRARITIHPDEEKFTDEIKAYSISIISTIKELLKLNPLFKEELQIFLGHSDFTEPGRLADFAVALTTAGRDELQEVLEEFDLRKRIDKALNLLRKELDLSRLQSSINQKIELNISKSQREFFLREQLKQIKRELGLEKDEKTADAEAFSGRLKGREVPPEAMKTIEDELHKLSTLEATSAEYSVCRNYLDWLTIVPWGVFTPEEVNLKKAHDVLEEDHYGLKDLKERIMEFISVGKLSGGLKGSILCLVGPPGVGKTSVGKSIARALGRQFYRFSVGGMHDEAEIKGHRRTYVGAMPGKMIQALKAVQTMNPVIMLDEVDKIGQSFHGDPASALLEVLDPEQNTSFLDHYLDVRCDLSNVLFICTANILDTIPEPLKDRMETLRLSGYIMEEKVQIAKQYLIPRNRDSMGLKANQVNFSDTSLRALINGYARESGVRGLENQIKKVLRKVAMRVVEYQEKPARQRKKRLEPAKIMPDNLKDYLGQPQFTSDRYYMRTPVGVTMGLAWTAYGGATLYVEALQVPYDKTEMILTGQAGDVMVESSQIAWSYLHSALERYAPGYKFFEKAQVHLHIPEGATPKDGPSAGITMTTSLLSLITNTPVENVAMTGELTLTGRILPIGGVREKVIASRRSKVHTLIFPKENERDYEELPEYIRRGLTVHFVEHYDEVVPIVFPRGFKPVEKGKGKKTGSS
jgi:ATP-dependent Lon protease